MAEFKIETKDARETLLPSEHRVRVRAVVTDSNTTCVHTVEEGKFCAPNDQLGNAPGIDKLVAGLQGNDKKIKSKISMGHNQYSGGYEKVEFVDAQDKPTSIPAILKTGTLVTSGENPRLVGVTKKD